MSKLQKIKNLLVYLESVERKAKNKIGSANIMNHGQIVGLKHALVILESDDIPAYLEVNSKR